MNDPVMLMGGGYDNCEDASLNNSCGSSTKGTGIYVLDATTGQNGLVQARVFAEVVDVTGIVLTKLDGTARGGIVVAVQRELGVPVKLVGLGETIGDLVPFDPTQFVEALFAEV